MEQYAEAEQYAGGEDPAVGDIVSRSGEDRWLVKDIEPEFGQLTCRCVQSSSWCEIGDEERLMPNRYRLITRAPEKAVP